jgi:hypothetical protein
VDAIAPEQGPAISKSTSGAGASLILDSAQESADDAEVALPAADAGAPAHEIVSGPAGSLEIPCPIAFNYVYIAVWITEQLFHTQYYACLLYSLLITSRFNCLVLPLS